MVSTKLENKGSDKKGDSESILIICIMLFSALVLWALFFFRGGGTDVSNDGNRVDEVRADIQSTRSEQREAIERIEAIQSGIADAENTANRVDTSINTSQGLNEDSASLIREGKSILRGIRERNEK